MKATARKKVVVLRMMVAWLKFDRAATISSEVEEARLCERQKNGCSSLKMSHNQYFIF